MSPRRARGWELPRERLFEKGDFKYVVLHLLAERPRHGYDITRALEERFGGAYAPSPGVVYPTLQMLDDMGYVRSAPEESRRVYTLTDEGRQFLEQNYQLVERILARLAAWTSPGAADEQHRVRHQLWELWRMFRRNDQWRWVEPEKIPRLEAAIASARREVEAILGEPGESPPPAPSWR